jgi:hypothetical protein
VIGGWLLKVLLAIAVIGFLAIELGSPLIVRAQLDGTAHDAANAAAREYGSSRNVELARNKAVEETQAGSASLCKDGLVVDEVRARVEVTVCKQAKSYLLHRIEQTRGWYDVSAKAGAVATAQ